MLLAEVARVAGGDVQVRVRARFANERQTVGRLVELRRPLAAHGLDLVANPHALLQAAVTRFGVCLVAGFVVPAFAGQNLTAAVCVAARVVRGICCVPKQPGRQGRSWAKALFYPPHGE